MQADYGLWLVEASVCVSVFCSFVYSLCRFVYFVCFGAERERVGTPDEPVSALFGVLQALIGG